MKILILTQYFPPEIGAPQTRLFELGQSLRTLGWEVEVLTAVPNYPTGSIYPDYKADKRKFDYIEGIHVYHSYIYPSKSKNIIPRMISYLSFCISAVVRGFSITAKPDIVFVESPPIFLGISAMILARCWKIPYVFNVSDLWPDSFVDMSIISKSSFQYKLLEMVEIISYKGSSGITGQSAGIVEKIQRKTRNKHVELITNGVRVDRFGKQNRNESIRKLYGWGNKCVFIYAGLHGLAQGLDQILDVADRLRGFPGIEFALFGDGPLKEMLILSAKSKGLENLKFYDPVKRAEIPGLLASADVAIISLGKNINGAVPSKIYEAMASELPILLIAQGEAAHRVESSNAGICIDCGDIEHIKGAVTLLAEHESMRFEFGRNGRLAAEKIYSRERIAKRLSDFLRTIIRIQNVETHV